MNLARYDKETRQRIEECERLSVIGDPTAPRKLRSLEKIAKEKGDNALLGFVHFYLANWYYDASQYESFQRALERAIFALLRSDAYDLLARAYNFFAIDAQSNDAFDVAYSYYSSALRFTDEKSMPAVTGIVIHNLATFYYGIDDHKRARQFFRKSIRMLHTNKEDPFYERNLLVAYISEAVASLMMGDHPAATRVYSKMKKLHESMDETLFTDVRLSYHFFELRYALSAEDKKSIQAQSERILSTLRDESLSFVEMDDVRDFCGALMKEGQMETVGEIIRIISPQVRASNITHSMRLLAELKSDYYAKIGDEAQLMDALQEQHRLLRRQKEEQAKIYKNSMRLIKLIGDLQDEQEAMALENEYLQEQIVTDELTQIPNRFAFDEELTAAFERAYKAKRQLGVEMMDVDGFKKYNDSFGHRAGDACLAAVGEILRTICKEEKVFCARYGGDEFVLIYEGKSDEEIVAIAKRIRKEIAACEVVLEEKKIPQPMVVSQGICNDFPQDRVRPWDFLMEADSALYAVKGKKQQKVQLRKLSVFA